MKSIYPAPVILDTDTYNEIDDQYALAYLLKSSDMLRTVGLTAAPFYNENSTSPEDGMERSYEEIRHLLTLMGREDLFPIVYKGSRTYLPDEHTPVDSPAARFIAEKANEYRPDRPLYIIAIGAITNVASALLMNPAVKENCMVIWLGGHAPQFDAGEFNMMQDIAAARVVMMSGIPFVQLPCKGVVDIFHVSEPELKYWLSGKNALCDYLVEHTVEAAERYAKGRPWSRVIWDVTAVAWLLDEDHRFMTYRAIPSPVPEYDLSYSKTLTGPVITVVDHINRDALFEDLVNKLTL